MAKSFNPWEYTEDKTRVRVVGGPTKNPKKLTGTRIGAVLGLNGYKSDFGVWCEIARVAEEPFTGNKYTEAGIAIEPKLGEWCKENISPYIVTPEQWFKTSEKLYDHFPKEPIFGGMWDFLVLDGPLGKGKPIGLVETKTSSRPQDWTDGVPASYAAQALLYAALLGVDRVFVPVAFLDPQDYDDPSSFVCTEDNTFIYDLTVSGSDIVNMMACAMDWYEASVVGNVSPVFDEKKDKVFLDIMRKSEVKSDGLEALAKEAAILEAKIEDAVAKAGLAEMEKSLKAIKDRMKPEFVKLFTDKDDVVSAYGWKVKRTDRETIDKEALKRDNLLAQYTIFTASYTMTKEKNND
jgi:hypothetical protein